MVEKAAEPQIQEEHEEEELAEETDHETEDIYDEKQRDEMLEDDEISGAEYAFMEGQEIKKPKKKRVLDTGHGDTPSVELMEEDMKRGSD
jgi:hypothetical protein